MFKNAYLQSCGIKWRMGTLLLSFFILFITYLFSFSAFAKETIYWHVNHLPPSTILSGPDKGQGFVDLILKQITQKLPYYEHQIVTSSLARSLLNMEQGKQVCVPAMIPTEARKNKMYFSQFSIVHPNNRIVMLNQEDGYIDILQSLSNSKKILGIDQGRSYGKAIDEIILTLGESNNIFRRNNFEVNNLIHMVNLGRLDYTIAYPFQVEYYLKQNHLSDKSVFRLLKVKGVSPYTMGSFACAKNDWGKQVIKGINDVLDEIKATESYKKSMTTWWKKEANDPEFIQYYQMHFIKNRP
jgi:uncharacterized protein (TIGR02285 family)